MSEQMTPEQRADRVMAWYEGHVAGSSSALHDEIANQIRQAEEWAVLLGKASS